MAVNNLNTPGVGIQPSIVDAKGDLLVGTAADAISRLGVTGTTGAVLTADAGETTGLKWAAAGSVGGLVHIETRTVTASSAEIFNDVFSATYDNYKVLVNYAGSALGTLEMRFRVAGSDNSTANYNDQRISGSSTSVASVRNVSQTKSKISEYDTTQGFASLDISNPFLSTASGLQGVSNRGNGQTLFIYTAAFALTTSFTGFSLLPDTGNISGTVRIYGVKN
jgi:hypothetical protein